MRVVPPIVMIENMEPETLHVSEDDLVRDVRSILRRAQAGVEVVIERGAQPVAILRSAGPGHRTISESIAMARAREEQTGVAATLDPDFAADIEEIIRDRKPRNPLPWG